MNVFGERHDGDGIATRGIRHIRGSSVRDLPGLLAMDSSLAGALTERYLGFDSTGLLRVYASLPTAPDTEGYVVPQMGGIENIVILAAGGSDRGFRIDAAVTDPVNGARQGALALTLERDTIISGTWDGNADIALKVASVNYAANGAKGRVCGGEILARNRGTASDVQGLVITGENYTGATNLSGDLTGLKVVLKNNGVVAGISCGLIVEDQSQGSTTGDHGFITLISNKNPASGQAEFGIKFMVNGTGLGVVSALLLKDLITNVLEFEDVDGTNGAWYDAALTAQAVGDCNGYMRVKIGANTAYIPTYATAPA